MRNTTTGRGGQNLCDPVSKRPAPPQTRIFAKLKRGDTRQGRKITPKCYKITEKPCGSDTFSYQDSTFILRKSTI